MIRLLPWFLLMLASSFCMFKHTIHIRAVYAAVGREDYAAFEDHMSHASCWATRCNFLTLMALISAGIALIFIVAVDH